MFCIRFIVRTIAMHAACRCSFVPIGLRWREIITILRSALRVKCFRAKPDRYNVRIERLTASLVTGQGQGEHNSKRHPG
jgi:hypothetical protein